MTWIRPLRISSPPSPSSRPIVKKLEEGDLALEKSLELYERGVQLSRFCHSRLEEAERRIEILNERGELRPAAAARFGDETDEGHGDATSSRPGSTRAATQIDAALERFLPRPPGCPPRCREAMRYSLDRRRQAAAPAAGARRRRSRRAERTAWTSTAARELALPAACALELIHTYSLDPRRSPRDGRRHAAARPADGARRVTARAWRFWPATAC